jgi:transposase
MQLIINAPKLFVAATPVDFRRSIDGLCSIIHEQMLEDPQAHIYVFHNTAKDKLKIIGWHKNGYVLIYKRLERGKFTFTKSVDNCVEISQQQLSWLIAGLDWVNMSSWDELKFDDFY